jgi:hypothetical protein
MPKFTDDVVRNALNGRKAVRVYAFPGAEQLKVGVCGLSDSEADKCRARAIDYCTRGGGKLEIVLSVGAFDRAYQREIVAAAYRDAAAHDEWFFEDADAVAELDAHIVTALYELYMTHCSALDPYAFCSKEEVNELVQQLGKSESPEGMLKLFEPSTLRSFVHSLVSLIRETQPQRKSSTGSSVDVTP